MRTQNITHWFNTKAVRNEVANMDLRNDRTHQPFLRLLAALLLVFLAVPSLRGQEPELADIDYDFYYPARAKGEYPTAWDPGEIDNVNLFNGNLNLSIPLDMVLEPGGDLSWQPVLHYNSKIWNDATRDDYPDTTNKNEYHMFTYEHSGYLATSRYAGLGWSLTGPYLHIKRVKLRNYHKTKPLVHTTPDPPYPVSDWDADPLQHRETRFECGETECVVFLLDSVVMPDGSHHSLRPCRDSWDCSQEDNKDDDNTWYSADGTGWKVTWTDTDGGGAFVAENGGLRYTFDLPFLIDSGYSVFYQSRDTDFIAGTRGWYCTKIESVRWPGPRIEFAYYIPTAEDVRWAEEPYYDPVLEEYWDPDFNRWTDPPILEKVTSYSRSGAVDATIDVSRAARGGNIFDPVTCGQATPPSSCNTTRSETIQAITGIAMTSSSGTKLAEYTFAYKEIDGYSMFSLPLMLTLGSDGSSVAGRSVARWKRDFRKPNQLPYANTEYPFGWDYLKTSTRGFPLLGTLTRVDTTGGSNTLVWSFDYSFANKMTDGLIGTPSSCDPCYSDFRTGLVSSVALPNGATYHYDFGHWHIMPHDINCDPPGRPGQLGAYMLPIAKSDTTQYPPLCQPVTRAVAAGVNQRWVEDSGKLLEWTEYVHSGPHSRYGPQAASWFATDNGAYRAYESVFNNFLIQEHAPFDFEHTDHDMAPLIPDEAYFTGISQTIVRKHLAVDHDPQSDAAKGLVPLPDNTTTELPNWRFDDTIHVFMTGAFVYDKNGDDSITDIYDHWGKLPIAGRPLQIRSYRGSAMCQYGTSADGTTCNAEDGSASPGAEFWWWLNPEPDNLLSVETFEYTIEWEQEPPPELITYDPDLDQWITNQDKNAYPNKELCGTAPRHYHVPDEDTSNELPHFCDGRSQNIRVRRRITEHRAPGSFSTFSGSESWYETDSGIPTTNLVSSSPTISEPKFASNQVLSLGLADYVTADPLSTTPAWTIESVTDFKKGHLISSYAKWYPSLSSRSETAISGTPTSREETSFSYNADLILSSRTRKGGSSPDVSTHYEYYGSGSEDGRYGRVMTLTLANSKVVGSAPDQETLFSYDITAYDYECQQLAKTWKLCAKANPGTNSWQEQCEGWTTVSGVPWSEPVVGGSHNLPAQLLGQQTIDPVWRRPTSRTDANGDGVQEISYDWLGRVTSIVPTTELISDDPQEDPPPQLASTFLEYPDLRTSLVKIQNDGSSTDSTVVARHRFDGLGRISHSAQRRQATTSDGYVSSVASPLTARLRLSLHEEWQ